MTCGKTISINTSLVIPGDGASWIANNPQVAWGDGNTDTGLTGNTASHTYTNIGEYTIVLSGENNCGETCTHTETALCNENPTGLSSSNVTTTSATVSWNAVPGSTDFKWELYSSQTLIGSGTTSNAVSVDLTGLSPYTVYTIYIDTMVGTNESGTECNADATHTFTTDCSVPACDFVVS